MLKIFLRLYLQRHNNSAEDRITQYMHQITYIYIVVHVLITLLFHLQIRTESVEKCSNSVVSLLGL